MSGGVDTAVVNVRWQIGERTVRAAGAVCGRHRHKTVRVYVCVFAVALTEPLCAKVVSKQ